MDEPIRGDRRRCSHDGCLARATSKGFCQVHYKQWNRTGTTHGPGAPEECSYVNCMRPVVNLSASLCQRHYANGGNSPIKGDRLPCIIEWCTKYGAGTFCRSHKERARKYNLSDSELIALYGDGSCMACGSRSDPHIHHDHSCCNHQGSCGECVIGLLCGQCNRAAGAMGDDPNRLRAVASVLELEPFKIRESQKR